MPQHLRPLRYCPTDPEFAVTAPLFDLLPLAAVLSALLAAAYATLRRKKALVRAADGRRAPFGAAVRGRFPLRRD